MIKRLRHFYVKNQFLPSFMGIFLNPLYFIRKGLYKGILANKNYLSGRLLDFGCGQKPYQNIFDLSEYIGLDIKESGHNHQNESIDVYYDGQKIPFADNYFDSVLASESLGAVFNLEPILKEINRVLKPGGHMLITIPFVWEENEIPYDFARYTSFGINYLLEKNGFEIIKTEKSGNYLETVFQMWNNYVYQYLFPNNERLKIILTPLFIAPITIIGIILSKILPKNKNIYHNNIIVVRKNNL